MPPDAAPFDANRLVSLLGGIAMVIIGKLAGDTQLVNVGIGMAALATPWPGKLLGRLLGKKEE